MSVVWSGPCPRYERESLLRLRLRPCLPATEERISPGTCSAHGKAVGVSVSARERNGNETNSQKKGSTDAQTTKGVNRMGKYTKFIAIAAINESGRAKADIERQTYTEREKKRE